MTAEEIKGIKKILTEKYQIDFNSDWFDDNTLTLVDEVMEASLEYAQQKQDKQELEILKQVKFGFDICSDHSTQCLGYRNLCIKINDLEQPTPPIE